MNSLVCFCTHDIFCIRITPLWLFWYFFHFILAERTLLPKGQTTLLYTVQILKPTEANVILDSWDERSHMLPSTNLWSCFDVRLSYLWYTCTFYVLTKTLGKLRVTWLRSALSIYQSIRLANVTNHTAHVILVHDFQTISYWETQMPSWRRSIMLCFFSFNWFILPQKTQQMLVNIPLKN